MGIGSLSKSLHDTTFCNFYLHCYVFQLQPIDCYMTGCIIAVTQIPSLIFIMTQWQMRLIPLLYMLYHNLNLILLSPIFLLIPLIILMRILKENYWIFLVYPSLIMTRFMESEPLSTINIILKHHKIIPNFKHK